MREELEIELIKDFPNTFSKKKTNHSFDHFGFEISDGWAHIVRKAAIVIENEIKKATKEEIEEGFGQTLQVKEKFGLLRWYVCNANDAIYKAIDDAEDESEKTCEECGAPGVLRKGSWLKTLCDGHSKR